MAKANNIKSVKRNLDNIIEDMSINSERFVKNPEKDFIRNRKLSFYRMLEIMLTMGGNSLTTELLNYFNYDETVATASAFVQQRGKINDSALPFLFNEFSKTIQDFKTHKGYRVLAADGSALNIYANPNDSETYFQSTPTSKGYNQLHLNAFYDLCNKVYTDIEIQPRRKMNETRALTNIIDNSNYPENTIIIADRNYESYNAFAHIEQKNYKYAIRVKDVTSSKAILPSLSLPETDEFDVEVNLKITRQQTKEIKANPKAYKFLPKNSTFDYLEQKSKNTYPISFRVVRFSIGDGKYECIITNLDKNQFSPEEIKELYQMRWGIETSFRELKYSIGLAHLHAKKPEFVEQEIYSKLIMYNFCSLIAKTITIEQQSTKHVYQVNFTIAIQLCKAFITGKSPPDIVENLMRKYILPIRENRTNERNINAKAFVGFSYRVA